MLLMVQYADDVLTMYHLDDFDDRFDLNKSKNVSNVDAQSQMTLAL